MDFTEGAVVTYPVSADIPFTVHLLPASLTYRSHLSQRWVRAQVSSSFCLCGKTGLFKKEKEF